jgi:hypothetical protein
VDAKNIHIRDYENIMGMVAWTGIIKSLTG